MAMCRECASRLILLGGKATVRSLVVVMALANSAVICAQETPAPVVRPAPIVTPAEAADPPTSPTVRAVTGGPSSSVPQEDDIRPANFQGVIPGKSSRADAERAMGRPDQTDQHASGPTLIYSLGPFKRVELWIENDLVTSIVAHLEQPAPPVNVTKELKLQRFEPVLVEDNGQFLGVAFPERGVLFSYVPDGDPQAPRVGQIVLEPVTAEPFFLRAQATSSSQSSAILADLSMARNLGFKDARAYWQEGFIRAELGQVSQATDLVRFAVKQDPSNADYAFTLGHLLALQGDFSAAREMVEAIRDENSTDDITKARAEHLLGQIWAFGSERDLRKAVQHQTTAVQLAKTLLQHSESQVQRTARILMIDAHLATAIAIAGGPFQQKIEVVPQWLTDARALMDEDTSFEKDQVLLHRVQRYSLAALAALQVPVDVTTAATATQDTGSQIISSADDPLYRNKLSWHLGLALYDVARIEQKNGRFAEALQFAREAQRLVRAGAATREANLHRDYVLGSTEFLIGSLIAVHQQDHGQAVARYRTALTMLKDDLPPTAMHELGLQGERFVSMGVSYWETGSQEEAVKLTKRGAALMERAVKTGLIDESALLVPYGNLSAMQNQLGQSNDAKQYSERAAAIQTNTQRR